MNHDRLLTQLSHVLDAPTEQRLFGVFSDIVGAAGGTAFDVVGGTTPAGGSAVRGLIGWCECHALHEASGEVAAFDGRPLFWGYARAEGVRATGQFRLGDATEFIDGMLAPVPMASSRGRSMLVRIASEGLDEDLAHVLVIVSLACTLRLGQVRAAEFGGQPLSPREKQVLHWLAEGKCAEDVAEILGISPATVMFHYRSVATRYGTLNRTHTVVEAMRRGALSLD